MTIELRLLDDMITHISNMDEGKARKVQYLSREAVHIESKQPKNFKKLKKFLFNFLNFQTKINFEKKIPQ